MKRISMALLVLLVLLPAPKGSALEGQTFAEAKAAGAAELTVVYLETRPFAWRTPSGSMAGFEAGVIDAFARWLTKEKGLPTTVIWKRYETFTPLMEELKDAKGGPLAVSRVSITDARLPIYGFSPPYLLNIDVLVMHDSVAEQTESASLDRILQGRTAVTMPDTTHAARVQELSKRIDGLKTELMTTTGEMVERIDATGGPHFGYMDLSTYWVAKSNGKALRRQSLHDLVAGSFGITMPKGSDWEPLLAEFLDPRSGFTTSPAYDMLVKRYFGFEFLMALKVVSRQQ